MAEEGRVVGSPLGTPLPRASGTRWGLQPHHSASKVMPDRMALREVAQTVQARLEGAAEKRARRVK